MSVIELVPRPSADCSDCIEVLREALVEAEAGRITAMSLIIVDNDHGILSQRIEGGRFMTLVGALAAAKHDMLQSAYQGDD